MATTYKIKDHLDKVNVNGIWVLQSTDYFVNGAGSDQIYPTYTSGNDQTFHFEFVVNMPTGGDVDGTGYWAGGSLQVSTDGGALTTPSDNSGGIGNQGTIKSGLAAGQHLLRLITSSPVYLKDIIVPTDATIISVARRTLYFPSAVTGTNMPNEASLLTCSGWWKIGDANSIHVLSTSVDGGVDGHSTIVELASNANALDVMQYTSANLRAGEDGVLTTRIDAATQGEAFTTVFSGLDGATRHLSFMNADTVGRRFSSVRLRRGARITVAASIADTVLTVDSSSGYAAGEWVEIGRWPTLVEVKKILSVGSGTITLTAGLSKAHAVGDLVSNFKEAQASASAWSVDRSAKRILADGDSRMHEANSFGTSGYYTFDPAFSFLWRALNPLNWDIANVAIAGGQSANLAANAPLIAGYSRGARDVYYGHVLCNDLTGNVPIPTMMTRYQTWLTAAKVDGGTSARYLLTYEAGSYANTAEPGNGNGDTSADVNTALDALAASNTTSGYTVEAVQLYTGLDYGNVESHGPDLPDGTHASNAGANKKAANLLGILYADRNVWRGSASGAWATGGNWSLGHAPTNSEEAVFGFAVTLTDTVSSSFAGRMRSIGGAVDLNASSISLATLAPVIDGTFTNYTTGPALSSPTATSVGYYTATVGVTANTAEGTIYAVMLPPTASTPDETSIRLGINPDTDDPAPSASAAGAVGVVNLGVIGGLQSNTGYTLWLVQQLADGSYTAVISLEGIETQTPPAGGTGPGLSGRKATPVAHVRQITHLPQVFG